MIDADSTTVKRSMYSKYATLGPTPMSALTTTAPLSSSLLSQITLDASTATDTGVLAMSRSSGPTTVLHQTAADAETGIVPEPSPDWRPFVTNFLLAWLVFACLVAVILFVSQVWEFWQIGWWVRMRRLMKLRKRSEGSELAGIHIVQASRDFSDANAGSEMAGRRSARATGLGISGPTNSLQPSTPRLRRPRSFHDAENISFRWQDNVNAAVNPFTAPLPPAKSFLSLSDRSSSSSSDLESGLHTPHPGELEDVRLPTKPELKESRGLVGFLESVNVAIEYAAGKLAKATYDHFDRPEEGLLLAIRDEERERLGEIIG